MATVRASNIPLHGLRLSVRVHVLIPSAVVLLLLSATVLGITAYWGSIFLPNIHRECAMLFMQLIPA